MEYNMKYMQRAIELAKKGEGWVNPNPLVGAVIVKNDRIIGEGYHARYGELHAERQAFASLTEDAANAQMYVTLEPCCHYGKQPPCVLAIVQHGISKVYVGSDDPNEKVCGKGVEYLRSHGIEVVTGVMKEECDKLNPVFFHYITRKTPYVALKYAMTMDGKIATGQGLSKWITNDVSRQRVQQLRNKYMGIMVGIGTVLKDDPMLNCRIEGGRNPVRIVCDSKLRIPLHCKIVESAGDIETIIATQKPESEDDIYREKVKSLIESKVKILYVSGDKNNINLRELMVQLGKMSIDGILLEGGGSLNYSALKEEIVNEAWVFVAPKIFGGRNAISPVEGIGVDKPDSAFKFELNSVENIHQDILLNYRIKEG